MNRVYAYTPLMPAMKDVQVGRIQQIMRETVSDVLCNLTSDDAAVICSSGGIEVRFDPIGPSYAEIGRHAQRLKNKVDEAKAAALRRAARGRG